MQQQNHGRQSTNLLVNYSKPSHRQTKFSSFSPKAAFPGTSSLIKAFDKSAKNSFQDESYKTRRIEKKQSP
jgi:hypothetical protein